MKYLVYLICCGFSFMVIAADIPEDVIAAENFDMQTCVSQKADDCINNICITSSALDCQAQCTKNAQEECKSKQE